MARQRPRPDLPRPAAGRPASRTPAAVAGGLAALALSVATALLAADAPPAKKALTLEAVSGPFGAFARGIQALRWRDGKTFTFVVSEGFGKGAKSALWEESAESGKKMKLLDAIPLDGVDPGGEPRTLPVAGALWSPKGTALLASGEDDLWLYELGAKAARRLTNDAAEEEHPTFSPDGSRVAYVKGNDLWVVDLEAGKETRLTRTGSATVLNGTLDWVYEEELAHRNGGRSFEWSPDSTAIAYLRLDQARVPEYPIVDFLPTNGKVEMQRYPCPGDPNAIPSVHLVTASGPDAGREVAATPDPEELVSPDLSFTADGKGVSFTTMDRGQSSIDAWLLSRDGTIRKLLHETDPAWINSHEPPIFLPDGSGFLWQSERSGFLHFYRYGMDGALRGAVTKGTWMVDGSHDLDAAAGTLTFVGTGKDPRDRQAYRVRWDGTGFTQLTSEPGTHKVVPAPGGAYLLDTFSSVDAPPKTVLRGKDGAVIRLVDQPANKLSEYALGAVELGSFTGSDGTLFYTRLVKPPDFDPSKRYPVIVDVYGGPHAQVVTNSFPRSAFDQLCASKGFLVFSMDNRGSWGRGHAFETPILKRMGEQELADQLEGIAWLKRNPWVDGSRIGIWGWSYGGYMTLYAATHAPETFKVAVAGAPVTHWKYYDSIYTERYMKLPADGKDAYEKTAPLTAAAKLGPKLLILHGTSDDNVHMQQTITFADALMRAGKDFTFVPLPRQKHGPRDPAARLYANKRILEFFEKNL